VRGRKHLAETNLATFDFTKDEYELASGINRLKPSGYYM
jgi:hypothetical protein